MPEQEEKPQGPLRSKDEVALDLMKFVATATGYGRPGGGAGFAGKGPTKSPEEHAEALLELYQKCRKVVES